MLRWIVQADEPTSPLNISAKVTDERSETHLNASLQSGLG